MSTPKNVIRRFPPFASFQKFLVSENSVGNITRQEIVSMIPPLLLDIKPGMTVLDLCAAPGSKSAQIIELVHGGEEARIRQVLEKVAAEDGQELVAAGGEVEASKKQAAAEDDYSDDGRATGLLIANDVDYRRAQMLIHQCKRLNSPNLIVVNHDATLFPSIRIPSEFGPRYLKFDRILADVPCSGDGTLRKNPEIWKEWAPSKALGLHTTQVRILVRALQMLKVGGRVVYSTCSMNPIENEAVIASAIDRCGGLRKVQLIDQSAALPGLKRRSGITSWKVMDKKGRWWNNWKDVAKSKEADGEEGMSKLVEGMFPPNSDEAIPLDRCVRIYPHLQDTGGFFITVLEKMSEIKARPENTPKSTSTTVAGTSTTGATTATAPASTGTSIMSVVKEIQSQTDTEANGLGHLASLDKILASQPDKDNDMNITGNEPAAARQNRENESNAEQSSSLKRTLDSEADAAATTKRMKTRDEPDEAAEAGAEDRQVHWPPPPGADLELTAHRHDESNNNNTSTSTPRSNTNTASGPNRHNQNPHEEPFKYLPSDHPELSSIYTFYGLSPRFPRDRFMVRNATGQPVKAIYYTSTLARDILTSNEGTGMKFVHCGVKMFVKQDVQNQPDACKWRIQSEGLPIIEAWISEDRVVRVRKREELRRLLVEMFPKLSSEGWQDLGEVGERARKLGMGCCVLRVEPTPVGESEADREAAVRGEPEGFDEHLVMPLWRGLGSVNLMLPKEERKAMLLRLFNDDSPLIDHSKEKADRERERQKEAKTEKKLENDDKNVDEDGDDDEVSALRGDDDDGDDDGGVVITGDE